MSVDSIRERLRSQIPEPVFTEGMTRAERRAAWDRYDAACQERDERLDEEHRLLGIGRSAAIYMTHEITGSWLSATAGRWYLALPERYMTPDSLRRPDWDHSHYPHDEHGHIGRVTTRQRPEPEPSSDEARQIELVAAILADIDSDPERVAAWFLHRGSGDNWRAELMADMPLVYARVYPGTDPEAILRNVRAALEEIAQGQADAFAALADKHLAYAGREHTGHFHDPSARYDYCTDPGCPRLAASRA